MSCPKLELYQFLIENLSFDTPNEFSKGFVETKKCGIISTDNHTNHKAKNIRSSCDFIETKLLDHQNNNNNNNRHPIIKGIYNNCIHIRSKLMQSQLTQEESLIRNEWALENKSLFKSLVSALKKIYHQDLADAGILTKYYIRVLSIQKPTTKVIILGDIHGSMHTLLRHLYRFEAMGFLDLITMTLTEDIKLIFLGDTVDRGIGSLEVLMMIFTLMINNINQVFFNRGNHECRDMNSKYGFKDELIVRDMEDLYEPINSFFDLLSCAIVLKSNEHKIWLSHGSFEAHYISIKKLNFKDAFVPFEPSKNIVGTCWNDLKEDEEVSKRGGYVVNFDRYDLTQFLDNNDINFVIRAHQDRYNNSYLFGPDYKPLEDDENEDEPTSGYGLNYLQDSNKTYILGKRNCHIVKFNYDQNDKNPKRINGPIATVLIDKCKFKKNKLGFYYADVLNETDLKGRKMVVFPCIVISTNTDYMRDLDCDSFVLLSF